MLDVATQSSLLKLSGKHLQDNDDKLMSSLKRCDWIATNLVEGTSAEELVKCIRYGGEFQNHEWDPTASWTLSYLQMQDVGDTREQQRRYTSKSLLNCIAQAIQIDKGFMCLEKTLAIDARLHFMMPLGNSRIYHGDSTVSSLIFHGDKIACCTTTKTCVFFKP